MLPSYQLKFAHFYNDIINNVKKLVPNLLIKKSLPLVRKT